MEITYNKLTRKNNVPTPRRLLEFLDKHELDLFKKKVAVGAIAKLEKSQIFIFLENKLPIVHTRHKSRYIY